MEEKDVQFLEQETHRHLAADAAAAAVVVLNKANQPKRVGPHRHNILNIW